MLSFLAYSENECASCINISVDELCDYGDGQCHAVEGDDHDFEWVTGFFEALVVCKTVK